MELVRRPVADMLTLISFIVVRCNVDRGDGRDRERVSKYSAKCVDVCVDVPDMR